MDSCDDTTARAAAMTYARSNIKRDTRPDAGDKFVRVQEEFHNDSPGHWRRNYDHAHTSPGVTARLRDPGSSSPSSGRGSPEQMPVRPEGREWVGNPVSGISPGRKVPKDNVNIAEPGRQAFFGHMAQQPNDDRASDAYEGAWLGNDRKLDDTNNRFTHDPSSRVYRGSRVAARINELGPHFMEGARGEGDSVAGHRARHAGGMIKRNDEGAIRPNMEPELGEFWNEADPHPPLNRGPKKVPEPVGRSGRQGMFGLLAHDPEVKSDYGRHGVDGTRARGSVHVKMPGSDTQIGKGSLLLYSNEYCLKNGLGGGGRMIDDDDDDY